MVLLFVSDYFKSPAISLSNSSLDNLNPYPLLKQILGGID